MAVFLKQEQNTWSIIPWTVHLGAGDDAPFVQTCRALPARHWSCHCLFGLQSKPHRYKLCMWNSWSATEELNSILHRPKPLNKLKTCEHMEPYWTHGTFVSTEFCAFQPFSCISSLLSFVHFPQLVEAHKYLLVLVRPRYMALEYDYTIHVTTVTEGLHFLA